MRFLQFAVLFSPAMIMLGCASLSTQQQVVCPYDTVWNATLDTMKEFPVRVKEKENGLIETGWTEMEGPGRQFGIFRRAAFDNKERARMIVMVKPVNNATDISITENREQWHKRGGVTSQAMRWWPVEPSQEAMTAVMNRINTKLKAQGCSVS